MTAQVSAPRDVQATVNYYTPLDDKSPYNYIDEPPAGVPTTNVGRESRSVLIHDARGKDDLGLDVSGFQFIHHPSVEKDFLDDDKIKTAYYTEVEELLKKYTDAKKVVIFDYTIRRSPVGLKEAPSRTPVQSVHVDQTFPAAIQRAELHLGKEAERLLKGRYRIINVWRPIANTVAHNPLALADYRTGGTFSVKYSPEHKWYYFSDQTPDEVTFIKCFDSDVEKARLTPHTAFHDTTSPPDAPQRQSIEVRALLFDIE
ncbi:hypothetical protein JVU11DRAFT_3459 [Chiua virens]|nr:hypothetical protein JVU11DRAFT_3459 [Chiua virens]